jgi:hypothetical protein
MERSNLPTAPAEREMDCHRKEQPTHSSCSEHAVRERPTAHTIQKSAHQGVETLCMLALEVKHLCHLLAVCLTR